MITSQVVLGWAVVKTLKQSFRGGGFGALFLVVAAAFSSHDLLAQDPVQFSWKPPGLNFNFSVGEEQSIDLKSHLENTQGWEISFSAVENTALPKNLNLDSKTGMITGKADSTGNTDVKIRANAAGAESQDLQIRFIVQGVSRPPVWNLKGPFKAVVGREFSLDLETQVSDPDNDLLTFRMAGDSADFKVDQGRFLRGTPRAAQPVKIDVVVNDGTHEKPVAIPIDVEAVDGGGGTPGPGIAVNQANLRFTAKEKEQLQVRLADPIYLKAPAGGTLTFTAKTHSLPGSAQLSPTGLFEWTPPTDSARAAAYVFPYRVAVGSQFSEGTALITVVRDLKPPVWTVSAQPPLRATTTATRTLDISGLVREPNGSRVTFSKVSTTEPWITVESRGVIVVNASPGNPAPAGKFPVKVQASNSAQVAEATLTVEVVDVGQPPKWKTKPVSLKSGRAGERYPENLNAYAEDPDLGDTITFQWISGADWMKVSEDGTVQGTPPLDSVGTNTVRLRVKDSNGLTADVLANVEIAPANQPPKWAKNGKLLRLLELTPAQIGVDYSEDLNRYAVDPEGKPLRFVALNKPSWLEVDGATGKLSGLPNTLESSVVVFEVFDAENAQASIGGKLAVTPPNQLPEFQSDPLRVSVREGETKTIRLVEDGLVKDPDRDPLTFTLEGAEGLTWLSLVDGKLTLKGVTENLGVKTYVLKVNDTKATVSHDLEVETKKSGKPPVWDTSKTYQVTRVSGSTFELDLTGYVTDPSGYPVTISKKDPEAVSWVILQGTATPEKGPRIFGRPLANNVGKHQLVLVASNGEATSEQTFEINVTGANTPPAFKQKLIVLKSARLGTFYFDDLLPYVIDPDAGDEHRFVRDAGQGTDWLTVVNSGVALGEPAPVAGGMISFPVTVTDKAGASDAAVVQIKVREANTAPSFNVGLLNLGTVPIDPTKPFSRDLSQLVTDDDKDELVYRIVQTSGPGWVMGPRGGVLALDTTTATEGDFTLSVEVSDAAGKSELAILGTLKRAGGGGGSGGGTNLPPRIDESKLVFEVVGGKTETRNLIESGAVADPEGETALRYEILPPVGWVTVESGILTVSPLVEDTGKTLTFVLAASDSKGARATGGISILVKDPQNPPPPPPPPPGQDPVIWLQLNPELPVNVGSTLSVILPSQVYVPSEKPVKFGLLSGVGQVSQNGTFTFRPDQPGTFQAKLVASIDPAFDPTVPRKLDPATDVANTFFIVTAGAGIPASLRTANFRLADNPVSGGRKSPLDFLFLLDNPVGNNGEARFGAQYNCLQSQLGRFFQRLDNSSIDYRIGVTTARATSGFQTARVEDAVLTSTVATRTDELKRRFSATLSDSSLHSPYMSLNAIVRDQFSKKKAPIVYDRVKTPLFVYALVGTTDQYPTLAERNSWDLMSWEKFSGQIVRYAREARKSFVSITEDMRPVSAVNYDTDAYSVLANLTKGIHSAGFDPCRDPNRLDEVTEDIVKLTYRYNHRTIDFSKAQLDPSKLAVSVRNKRRNGQVTQHVLSRGGAPDEGQWYFDADKGILYIHWWNIVLPMNPTEDELLVAY